MHVSLYLTDLLNNGSSEHPVSNAVYGIKWEHELSGLDDPTENSFVTSIPEAAKRVAHKKTHKEDPITTETLIEIWEMHKDSSDLHVIRDLTRILLCFAGFLRYDEVSSLRVIDIDIHDSFLVFILNKVKLINIGKVTKFSFLRALLVHVLLTCSLGIKIWQV